MTNAIKILLPAAISFMVGLMMTPVATHYFYKYKMWRKVPRSKNLSESGNFNKIHNGKEETSTPRIGGMIIWMSVIFTIFIIWIIDISVQTDLTNKLYFISRNQTKVYTDWKFLILKRTTSR